MARGTGSLARVELNTLGEYLIDETKDLFFLEVVRSLFCNLNTVLVTRKNG